MRASVVGVLLSLVAASVSAGCGGASNTLFVDEFNAAAGSPPDSASWNIHREWCDVYHYSCAKPSNVFHDGQGNMVVRTQREACCYLGGGPYSGGWIDTFGYGTGWPPSKIKRAWNVPYRIEMRALMPNTPGAWPAAWNMNVDRPTSQNIYELDWAEQRMTHATRFECHQHTWLSGKNITTWDCPSDTTVSNMGTNWHVYGANVYTDRVEYSIDSRVVSTAYGVSGRHGVILSSGIGDPNHWSSACHQRKPCQPDPSDPGPWDMKVDYIRVTGVTG